MECAWISNFVILETEALLTFCQEEHGVGSERARAGAGLKAGFLRQKNISCLLYTLTLPTTPYV